MTTIWKYPLTLSYEQVFEAPYVRRMLTVQLQHGQPTLWMAVDPEARTTKVKVFCLPTGGDGPQWDWQYLGTVQLEDSGTVWHYFTEVVVGILL